MVSRREIRAGRARDRRRNLARRRAAYAATLAALLLASTAAHAQLGDVGEDTADTDVTPVAKETKLWQLVAGARYPEEEVIPGSATTYESDLFTVAFRDPERGFAGGSEEIVCEGGALRVPVIYRYRREPVPGTNQTELRWSKHLQGSCDSPGYVGAIAWMAKSGPPRAMAVGGTGAYPRREPGCDSTDPACIQSDPAGLGRAWLYDPQRYGDEGWHELDLEAQRSDPSGPLRGMSALDFHSPALGAAGALGQIWHIENGEFTKRFDRNTPYQQFNNRRLFRHRVRDLEFVPESSPPAAFAVTAGCCGGEVTQGEEAPSLSTKHTPRILRYDGLRWAVDPPTGPGVSVGLGTTAAPSVGEGESLDLGEETRDGVNRLDETRVVPDCLVQPPVGAFGCLVPRPSQVPAQPLKDALPEVEEHDAMHEHRQLNPTQSGPGSYYALVLGEVSATTAGTVSRTTGVARLVESPSGPRRDGEPASRYIRSSWSTYNTVGTALGSQTPHLPAPGGALITELSTVRLVSADMNATSDWAVGELRSSRTDGRGAQAAAYAPHLKQPNSTLVDPPSARCKRGSCNLAGSQDSFAAHQDPIRWMREEVVVHPSGADEVAEGRYTPLRPENASPFLASPTYRLPSYSLNAVELLPEGGGFAVGDHGAILALDAEADLDAGGRARGEEQRPRAPRPAALPERSPYAGLQPPSSEALGEVPPLGPTIDDPLAEPRVFPAGRGGATSQIVMSRDGSEGWAIANPLTHYDGLSWNVCGAAHAPGGDARHLDPACIEARRSLAELGTAPARAVRVPLEKDADPTNDDQFELLALGSDGSILRFREGRWEREGEQAREAVAGELRDLACTAPDDCWILGQPDTRAAYTRLFRFDGERWIDCAPQLVPDEARLAQVKEKCGIADLNKSRIAFPGESASLVPPQNLTAAGDRVYLFGWRSAIRRITGPHPAIDAAGTLVPRIHRPMIIYRERGGTWEADPAEGGLDPLGDAGTQGGAEEGVLDLTRTGYQGYVSELLVSQRPDGRYEGWAVGLFGGKANPRDSGLTSERDTVAMVQNAQAETVSMHSSGGPWRPFHDDGALGDHFDRKSMRVSAFTTFGVERWGRTARELALMFHGPDGEPRAFVAQRSPKGAAGEPNHSFNPGRFLTFDRAQGRWRPQPLPLPARLDSGSGTSGVVTALAPDNRGGFWAAVGAVAPGSVPYYLHYTDQPPEPVFAEVPHPITEPRLKLTALASNAAGELLLTTDSAMIARYDRVAGWQRARIPGWDPKRLTGAPNRASAVALGPTGEGIAVGEGGRIARITGTEVGLDPAMERLCELDAPLPPCGTRESLYAADIAPDGSAMVGGERRALLWRPAGGELRAIDPPPVALDAAITHVSMPAPGRAWVMVGQIRRLFAPDWIPLGNRVFSGELGADGRWRWRADYADEHGDPASLGAIFDLELDAAGSGYAVGEGGLIWERRGDRPQEPWRKITTRFNHNLRSVALPEGRGSGALFGGENGAILTLYNGRLETARFDDYQDGNIQYSDLTGPVVGLALLPGPREGQAEAWAAIRGIAQQGGLGGVGTAERSNRLLHYASDPQEPLLNPDRGAVPLRDAPAPRPGEVSFAAFGKTECSKPERIPCLEMSGNLNDNEVVAERIVEELSARARQPGGPAFALFTGDGVDSGDQAGANATEAHARVGVGVGNDRGGPNLRRFRELVTERLTNAGVPVLPAIGAQDLSEVVRCSLDVCITKPSVGAGDNLLWRRAMARAFWASGDEFSAGGLSFVPVAADSILSPRGEDVRVEDPDGEGGSLRGSELHLAGGAPTHYAVDVLREGEKLARVVAVDTSLRSLAASDPLQQPLEPGGGQAAWLEEMLCFEGSVADTDGEIGDCTREPSQLAIVLTNTPTYSYGPGAGTETQTDAAAFEAILLKNKANVVVSGRLGWNGLYWATAPGLHEPCPGQGHPSEPPQPGTRICGQGSEVAEPSEGLGGAVPELADGTPIGLLPFVVASGGGGKFNESARRRGATPASDGFWRGYSIVRLHPSGDPRHTIVEQRPLFDWVQMTADSHVLLAGQEMTLRGVGKDTGGLRNIGGFVGEEWVRYSQIDSPAVTHRYELLLADPEQPWMPCEASDAACVALASKLAAGSRSFDSAAASGSGSAQDDRTSASRSDAAAEGSQSASATATSLGGENPCNPYLCLPQRVGTVDSQTGEVKAGNGKYPDTFAIAMLSVDDHVATYPLMFKKSPSFVIEPFALPPATPAPAPGTTNSPSAPAPPNPPTPNVPEPSVPEVPLPPSVPPLAAAQPPEPQPPAPPAPPPPTEQLSPLDLTISPASLTVATPAAVIQPPTPPVNPAPPSGARREARQRQAATQKSGADGGQEGSEAQSLGGDLAQSPLAGDGTAQATRRDRTKPEPSFTTLSNREQPSAWTTGLLYGGGITLLALAAALGWTSGRPTPRRRPPEVPAPAQCNARNYRR